jgi:hypothetical protein
VADLHDLRRTSRALRAAVDATGSGVTPLRSHLAEVDDVTTSAIEEE